MKGLGWGQRLAYLEGALHWLNTLPRLALLLSVGWLNRGSRHALLADLPGWATAIPLSTCVLQGIWGRVMPFRITPKHRVRHRGGIDPLLGRPLLLLLLLNGFNLAAIGLALGTGGANPQLALGLLWAGLNLLGLLVALRVCWDRPCPDPTPWLGIKVNVSLWGPEQQQLKGRLTALAETGADLVLPGPGPVGPGWRLVLDAGAGSLLPLDLAPLSRGRGTAERELGWGGQCQRGRVAALAV